MDAPSPPTATYSSKDDISLYILNTIILRIFFVIGLASVFLSLHHARPSTLLAIFLLLLTILLFKALWDFLLICFIVCPCLWTFIIFLLYSWWYLRSLF